VVVLSEKGQKLQCALGLHAMPVTAVVPLPSGDTLSVGFDNFVCVGNARETMAKQVRAGPWAESARHREGENQTKRARAREREREREREGEREKERDRER